MKRHYGVWYDETTPVGSVYSLNELNLNAFFDALHNGTDLGWEAHLEECENEDHDDCGPEDQGTILIGSWILDDEGFWEPDTSKEYAAIAGEIYIQCVWSQHTGFFAPCSPCYPGQADAGTPRTLDDGGMLCYVLPPDMTETDNDG